MADSFFDEQSVQSQIKAQIVADYFWAWANVIIHTQKKYPRHAQKIGYVDLFAGPGRYENGAASTPLLVMQRAVADADITTPGFARLAPAQANRLRDELASLWSLQEVVRWGFAQSPSYVVIDVIVQDEFTHDVVMHAGDIYLVFDST